MRLQVDTRDERTLLLTAVGMLMLDIANEPGGPSPKRLLLAGTLAAQLAQGAERIRVPPAIVADLEHAIDEALARSRMLSA